MSSASRSVAWLVFAAALTWHVLMVVAPPKIEGGPAQNTAARDYASYHYAAVVAAQGGDPYDKSQLDAAATAEGLRTEVHPFFYPPPFLLAVAWAPSMGLLEAFDRWSALQEVALLVAMAALWRWWRDVGPALGPVLAALVALTTAVSYGYAMGQANALVLAVLVLGLWAEARDRVAIGGALVGLAAMLKMSPALFVLLWLVQGRWRSASWAVAAAVALSLATLPILGAAEQFRFYTEILPGFGSGDYNGLTIKVTMFANHSVPNLFAQLWPLPGGERLSETAQHASTAFALALVGYLAWALRVRATEPVAAAAQVATVATASLFLPVYTYEHHLLWAIPGVALAVTALFRGRLRGSWAIPLAAAFATLVVSHITLKTLATETLAGLPWAALLVQESKFLALVISFCATLHLARSRPDAV